MLVVGFCPLIETIQTPDIGMLEHQILSVHIQTRVPDRERFTESTHWSTDEKGLSEVLSNMTRTRIENAKESLT